MNYQKPVITFLSFANIAKCVIGGLCYLIPGLILTARSSEGQGLSIIFGIPFLLLAFTLLWGIKPALLLLNGHSKGRSSTINTSIASSLLIFIPFILIIAQPIVYFIIGINILNLLLFVNKIKTQFRQDTSMVLSKKVVVATFICGILTISFILPNEIKKYQAEKKRESFNVNNPTKKMMQTMMNDIDKEFTKKETVVLHVYYYPPFHTNPEYLKSESAKQRNMHEGFVKAYYLIPIGSQNIIKFKMPQEYSFMIELNKKGYENLKKITYTRSYELFDTKFYGWYKK